MESNQQLARFWEDAAVAGVRASLEVPEAIDQADRLLAARRERFEDPPIDPSTALGQLAGALQDLGAASLDAQTVANLQQAEGLGILRAAARGESPPKGKVVPLVAVPPPDESPSGRDR